MASTSLISVTDNMLFDLNGRKNKSIRGLFDNDLDTKMNLNITNEDPFILPYHSFVVLPNVYNNFRIDYYDRFGSGPILNIKLYSSSKALLGTFDLTTELFNAWKTLSGTDGFSDVRFLEVTADSNFNFEAGIYEVKLYGDVVSAASPIFPSVTINPVPDLGKHAHSVNILDDRFKRKDGPSGNGDNILLKIAGSTRIGFEATKWDYYPNHFTNPSDGLIWLGRNGSDNLARRVADVAQPNDIEVQMYRIGGSLKDLPEATASNNTAYIQDVNALFRITSGGDKETEAAWQPLADLFYKLVALYGSNAAADMTGITVTGATGPDAAPGQNIFQYFEIGNEDDKDWLGGTSFLSPRARLAKIRKVASRMKQADPNCKPMVDAATFMNNTYFRAMGFINYWDHNNEELPIYGFNFNLYLNSDLDGQGGSGVGVSPEVWNLKNRLVEFKSQMDEMFPNKVVFWSEFGTAADPASPWYIAAVGSKTARQVCADMALRIEAICQSVRFIPKMNYYTFFEDGSWPFNSMAVTHDVFNEDPENTFYIRTEVYPIGYALANKFFLEKDYNWFSDELIYGGTTGKHVRRKSHATDANKKLFKVWMGTSNGSTLTNEPLDIGSDAISATLYSLRYDQWTPSSLSLSITGSTVTIPTVEEGMKWVEVTYSSPSTPSGMPTIPQLKTNHDTIIRTETSPGGITRAEVATQLDNLADEQLQRGVKIVSNTTALSSEASTDFRKVFVTDIGLFEWSASGTANGTTIFAASGGGVWILRVKAGSNAIVPVSVSYAGTMTLDTDAGNWFEITLGGNPTINFSNLTGKKAGVIIINNGAAGTRSITWPGSAVLPTAGLALSPNAGEVTVIGYMYNGANIYLTKENYGTAPAGTYLTWGTLGADMETYNTAKGIRKKSSSGNGWSYPTLADASAVATQTLSNGERLIVKVASGTALATSIILSTGTTPNQGTLTGINYGFYAGYSLTAFALAHVNNNPVGSSFAISAGDLLRISYIASVITFEHSNNGGVSWTTIHTSVVTPSGSYNICMNTFSPNGGFDEVYKP